MGSCADALSQNEFGHFEECFVKVHLSIDEEVNAAFPDTFMSRVRVRRTDGAWHECTATARGSDKDPLTSADVRAKFLNLLDQTPWSRQGTRVIAAIEGLPMGGRISEVMNAFNP